MSIESVIELIKQCQNYNRIDLFSFAKEREEVIECQETDVSPTFLGLSSPYLLPEKFIKHKKKFNTEYAPLPQNEKTRMRKFLLNVPVGLQVCLHIQNKY